MIFRSLLSRVIILSVLLLMVGVGSFSLLHIRREQSHLLNATRESAELLLSTIEKSIFSSMRVGNSEDVQAILELVGRSHQLTNVRIFHPDGTVLKSARPQEIGGRLVTPDLALFKNNQTEGIFRVQGEEVLAMIKPIYSDERCFLCHGFGRKVIGVLNLNFSLAETTERLADSTHFFLATSGLILLLLSMGITFILYRFVKGPIHDMAEKMIQVENGDLSVRLQPRYTDEVGSLMNSFNSMVDKLEKAKEELEQYHYQQMARADRLASVGEMATGIAHEIKNPLAGIKGAISVIFDDFEPEDPRREVVSQILDQIGRLDKTATDLLYFGKPSKPEFTFVDVNNLVKETLFFISQHPEARNIHRVKELTRNLPAVWVDPKQMQQVLFNIILNAMQAMKEGGTLTIETDLDERGGDRFIQIRIGDTGKGIPPDQLERIFVPFFTTKTQGTGLGLPICRQLVEQHGGRIQVQSKEGDGTTFILELPVKKDQPTLESEGNSAQT